MKEEGRQRGRGGTRDQSANGKIRNVIFWAKPRWAEGKRASGRQGGGSEGRVGEPAWGGGVEVLC